MVGEWVERPLAELCAFLNRGAAPSYTDHNGLLVLNQKCVRDGRVAFTEARRTDPAVKPVSRDRLLKPFDVLVNSTGVGTLGRVAQLLTIPEATTADSHVTIVRADPRKVIPRFLGFTLRNYQSNIEALAEGSTGQTELSRAQLSMLQIPLPPLPEQRAIAHILGVLDDKIELNRWMNETLEKMARALFRSWFVDFDPVRAKVEGHAPGLPKPIADLFPDSFQDSEFGEIPKGWRIAVLGDHFDAVKGVSYKGSGLSEIGIPMHNLNSVYEGGGYKYEGIKFYNGEYAERHLVKPGDVIVANTEQGHDRLLIGYAALVPCMFGEPGIFSHHLYRLRPRSRSELTAVFLCHLLNSQQMHDVVSGYANGTTVNMLPAAGVQQPQIIVPPDALVAAFSELAIQVESRRAEMVLESRTLATLRDALLPKLISGELRVKEGKRLAQSKSEDEA